MGTGFADRVWDGDEPARDGRADELVRLAARLQALRDRRPHRSVTCGGECGLEQHMSQRPPPTSDCPLASDLSTVVRHRSAAGHGCGLAPVIRPGSGISARSMAAETGPVPGMDRRSRAVAAELFSCAMTRSIRRSRAPTLGVRHGLDCIVHGLDVGGDVVLPAICAISHKPFAHLNDPGPARWQSSENTQILTRQRSCGFGPEPHEPGDEFRIARSVFARVPRARAKAFICAGGRCFVSIPTATRMAQSPHS